MLDTFDEVFITAGMPTVTYVVREHGIYEQQLNDSLSNKGSISLVTGSSKTGKSTLVSKVISSRNCEELYVRCVKGLSPTDIWKQALEQVDFFRLEEVSRNTSSGQAATGKLGGGISLGWFAGMHGEAGVETSRIKEIKKTQKKVLAKPAPSHLVPFLLNLPYILVLEDFHKLDVELQEITFQQVKVLYDNKISIIVIETTHHAPDITYANEDLIGRVTQINLPSWQKEDLSKIISYGMKYLNISFPTDLSDILTEESVGLPFITQQVCRQLLLNKEKADPEIRNPTFLKSEIFKALHQVAMSNYSNFGPIHDRFIQGPRKKARKYNTYELVLKSFTYNPLMFSLTREQIDERIKEIAKPPEKVPPTGSVTSALSALNKFQDRLPFETLEWRRKENKLYIIEPAFLYYLRWCRPRIAEPKIP